MQIKTISFDPLVVKVNGVITPVVEHEYADENGVTQKIFYIIADGEKRPIRYEVILKEYLEASKVDGVVKLDSALEKVEEARIKKI